MAAIGRMSLKLSGKNINFNNVNRFYSSFKNQKTFFNVYSTCACVLTGGLVIYTAVKWKNLTTVHALKKMKDEVIKAAVKLTARERRFIKFSSVEFDGQLYMTPQDFLDSVIEEEPRPRLKRKLLSMDEIENLKNNTPVLKNGSTQMFRGLRDKGIISYTEYLFLLSILTKPQSGFRIAFNMFDTDGNQRVDKMEFLVIRRLLGGSLGERVLDEATRRALLTLVSTQEQATYLFKPKKNRVAIVAVDKKVKNSEGPPKSFLKSCLQPRYLSQERCKNIF